MTEKQKKQLYDLAKLAGLQIRYFNKLHNTDMDASVEAIVGGLKSLGLEIKEDLSNLEQLASEQEQKHWHKLCDPVAVHWQGSTLDVDLRIPIAFAGTACTAKLSIVFKPEKGKSNKLQQSVSWKNLRARKVGDKRYVTLKHTIPKKLWQGFGLGYHQMTFRLDSGSSTLKQTVTVFSAPLKAYQPIDQGKKLGVFAPLYSVWDEKSWGIGDYTQLGRLVDWAYKQGCDFVGALPMLAIFSDQPLVEPSPYSPISKLFWSELYINPEVEPEWEESRKIKRFAKSDSFKKALKKARQGKLINYPAVAKVKREALSLMAKAFFDKKRDQENSFKSFLRLFPLVEEFAVFRAICDKRKKPWSKWPKRLKNGEFEKDDYSQSDYQYHLYCQYVANKQITAVTQKARRKGLGIYLDLPLSIHKEGFDVWKMRHCFGKGAAAGCPPDAAHVLGQNWGILPLHPGACRDEGYFYLRQCLANQMRYCGLLRLDHVMHLYRLYWVPKGLTAKDGVYVLYNLDEMFAILTIESHRNQCILIGEDLGTVPAVIRQKMKQHGLFRYYVQQRKIQNDEKLPIEKEPADCITSFGTHDMAPFAAFWQHYDLEDKMKLGYFDEKGRKQKSEQRKTIQSQLAKYFRKMGVLHSEDGIDSMRDAFLKVSAKGPARFMQVNLEDLWLEDKPQNVPATQRERPNWRRRLRQDLSSIDHISKIGQTLQDLSLLRKASRDRPKIK
jgi:4-alpha-glucanotransferase